MLSLCGRDWNMNEERLAMTGISKKSILDRVRLGIGGGQDLGWDFSLFFPFLSFSFVPYEDKREDFDEINPSIALQSIDGLGREGNRASERGFLPQKQEIKRVYSIFF